MFLPAESGDWPRHHTYKKKWWGSNLSKRKIKRCLLACFLKRKEKTPTYS
jgi:hypothetical protein